MRARTVLGRSLHGAADVARPTVNTVQPGCLVLCAFRYYYDCYKNCIYNSFCLLLLLMMMMKLLPRARMRSKRLSNRVDVCLSIDIIPYGIYRIRYDIYGLSVCLSV